MTQLPEAKDARILTELAHRYRPLLESVHESVINSLTSLDVSVYELRDFVYRHAIPFYAYIEATGSRRPEGFENLVTAAILTYSFPLMSVDLRIDGDLPALRDGESVWHQLASQSTLLKTSYHGFLLAAVSAVGRQGVAAIVSASKETIAAMERDHKLQWNRNQLVADERQISEYWASCKSRLHGSHITDLMFELSAMASGGTLTIEHRQTSAAVGKLRQVADEHMDVWEDVCGGLVTFPVMCSLANAAVGARLRRVIESVWKTSANGSKEKARPEFIELVLEGGGPNNALALEEEFYSAHCALAQENFKQPEPVIMLLSLRHEQLKRAIDQRLSDPPPHASIPGLLGIS